MSKIRGKDTKPEVALRKALWAKGIRYLKNYKKLNGNPDIYISKHRLAIFIDGEFWHGYKWAEKKEKIKSNKEYWIPKIERNMARDMDNNQQLEYLGITVLRFWEHEIKKDLEGCVKKVIGKLG
ncbi:T/G mismatch-specific endonuclease [Cyclobacterium lianum]|uniref:T/G mismatch-specific endonuclease n=2 Tax=Cyclobacterium lianum TaxID=388280 RepID=A0A1M7M3U8_9BACT|nr:T/G mismatch-specific endonuclease [Cyclobacterium lianum]